MFPLLRKNVFFLISRSSFSSSSSQLLKPLSPIQLRHFSSSPPPRPKFRSNQIMDAEYNLRVSVLWDFETCGVPPGVSYSKVAPSITGALRANGFTGLIHIEAYGNVYQLSDINQQILSSSGVDLHHIPGGKTSYYRFLMDWWSKNPRGHAHLFIISGDRDHEFIRTLSRLSVTNCKILFACPGKVNPYICHASVIMWQWSKLLEGKFIENLADMTLEENSSCAHDA